MRKRTRITLGALAVTAALAGGVAWATIPGDGGVYTACKLNATGTIRLIDPSLAGTSLLGRCTAAETQVTWNQKGQKGDPGAAGVAGATGAQGPRGDTGAAGNDGATGDACLSSDPACVGPKGDKGEPGASGTNGVDGQPGAKGDPCLSSDPACVGPPGAKGDKGDTGSAGPVGPAGNATTYTVRSTFATGCVPATADCAAPPNSLIANCLPGEQVTGGGGIAEPAPAGTTGLVPGTGALQTSRPFGAHSWAVTSTPGSRDITAYVICASQ